jgi:hypothetical protein
VVAGAGGVAKVNGSDGLRGMSTRDEVVIVDGME